MTNAIEDVGFDLEITKVERQESGDGVWVRGRLCGHRFNALVYGEHAENEEYELGRSRLSKLWVQRLADKVTVFNWDRGSDVEAKDDVAQAIVDFLVAGWRTTSTRNNHATNRHLQTPTVRRGR